MSFLKLVLILKPFEALERKIWENIFWQIFYTYYEDIFQKYLKYGFFINCLFLNFDLLLDWPTANFKPLPRGQTH